MTRQVGSQLDLLKIPVKNIVVEQGTSAPSSPANGQLWYDTTNNQLKGYINGTWVQLDNVPGGTASNVVDGDKGMIVISSGVWNIDTGVITDTMVAAANKDGATGTASMRTLGLGSAQAMPGNTRLDQISAPTASVSMNTQRLTTLLDPSSAQDAATKNYVDSFIQGIDAKGSVVAASTATITQDSTQNPTGWVSGFSTVDGVAATNGQRVLLKDQSSAQYNGIYTVNVAGPWTRATDMDAWTEVPSSFVFVEKGTVNADSGWVCTADQGGTLGTTAITWTQFSGAGSITAGAGLTKTGNSLDVVAGDASIVVSADSLKAQVASSGSIGIGVAGLFLQIRSTTAAIEDAGSGLYVMRKASGGITADANGLYLDTTIAGRKLAGALGALSAGVETTFTHNLGTKDVACEFRIAATDFEIDLAWRSVDTNTIGVTADVAFSASAIRVLVVG